MHLNKFALRRLLHLHELSLVRPDDSKLLFTTNMRVDDCFGPEVAAIRLVTPLAGDNANRSDIGRGLPIDNLAIYKTESEGNAELAIEDLSVLDVSLLHRR